MKLFANDNKIILRDVIQEDMKDYVLWNTEMTEWQKWDAPWEIENVSDASIRKTFQQYYQRVKSFDVNDIRTKLEICLNDASMTHIGWVIHYLLDKEYKFTKEEGSCAVGLDIPNPKYRKNGYGTSALITYITYLKENGKTDIYTQTWSGNHSMINLANKLGFIEVNRYKDYRLVNGKLYDAITWML